MALGLDAGQVSKLSAMVGQVVYSRSEQVDYFKKLLSIANEFWKHAKDNEEVKAKFHSFLFMFSFCKCLMKNPAFSEEKEVRLVRAVVSPVMV